jgi:hypothetical protein
MPGAKEGRLVGWRLGGSELVGGCAIEKKRSISYRWASIFRSYLDFLGLVYSLLFRPEHCIAMAF